MHDHLEYLAELCWDLYKFEHDRKDKIYTTAAMLLSALTVVLGGMAYLLPRLPGAGAAVQLDLRTVLSVTSWLSAAAGFGFLVWCFVLAFKIVALNAYTYVPEPKEIAAYAKALAQFHRGNSEGSAEVRTQKVVRALKIFIVNEAGRATRESAKTNDQRIMWRNELWILLAITGILVVMGIVAAEVVSRNFGGNPSMYCD